MGSGTELSQFLRDFLPTLTTRMVTTEKQRKTELTNN